MNFQELYEVLNGQLNAEAFRLAEEALKYDPPSLDHTVSRSEQIVHLFLSQLPLHGVVVDSRTLNDALSSSREYFEKSYRYHFQQLHESLRSQVSPNSAAQGGSNQTQLSPQFLEEGNSGADQGDLKRSRLEQQSSPLEAAPGIEITPEFARALELLNRGSSIFLTGKAGTGKSTLIRRFLSQTTRNAVTVAPTGIAALNVDGYTIHRLFSFHAGINEEDVRSGNYYPGRFADALSRLDTLIIDEVSMVRADLFDTLAAALERFGPKPGAPFGGVQLVLVGDLYQLPPVVTERESKYIAEKFGTPYFFSAKSFSREQFPTVELTTVFRQINDRRMVDLLNAVRSGALLEAARAELNRQTQPDFDPALDEFWLTLATTNRIVGARNKQMLERLTDRPSVFTASVSGETDGFEYPADEKLQLAVGAQVMLLNNDEAGRWVNGTIGKIEDISENGSETVVSVLLRNGQKVDVSRHQWEITRPYVDGGSLRHEVIGSFRQFPMKLAWAITIHKSQGQTLDRVVVDLTGGTFANGQLYVALSRCTSLDGLVLKRDVLPRDLKTDILVRRFLEDGTTTPSTRGRAFISVLSVGNEGDRYRPRPVEIAVVTDDGDEAHTIVNPTSDLFSAQKDFGITTQDVALAPVLTEAWAALAPVLTGRVPTGVNVDHDLGIIDYELKRNGVVTEMPLGAELPQELFTVSERQALQAPQAIARARALRDIAARLEKKRSRALKQMHGFPFAMNASHHGYLLQRASSSSDHNSPELFTVGGYLTMEDDAALVLAQLLRNAWDRVVDPNTQSLSQIRSVEGHFGVQILPEGFELAADATAETVLVAGARVCFTGEVVSEIHGVFSRDEMNRLAENRGLVISANMTKTKTDVLVVAARGSQSGKAKKAAEWGKPVLAAEEFLDWALKNDGADGVLTR
ncbi:AAA family ATPase [Leucobacter sp. CSA2]|uniref:AAA family ATPase n=1 Tax=Leucobacter edaphi TaxID=2796472 RepID=A0A934UYQ8_9MICO|nr:AAA family ATPase [Leucobacter edaphi]MBK0422627.1 AAA family ATPase [Leucobacter edaphi]